MKAFTSAFFVFRNNAQMTGTGWHYAHGDVCWCVAWFSGEGGTPTAVETFITL